MSVHPEKRIRVFPERYERFILFLPLPFMALACLHVWNNTLGWTRAGYIGDLVGHSLFLNTVHVVFNFPLLGLPEFKSWVQDRTRQSPWKFWLEIGVIYLFFVACYHFTILGRAAGTRDFYHSLVGSFLGVYLMHHTVAQVFGLSALYTFRMKRDLPFSSLEQDLIERGLQRERFFSRLLFLLIAAYMIVQEFALGPKILRGLNLTCFAVAFACIGNAFSLPSLGQRNKLYYLVRMLLFPLSQLSLFGLAGIVSCHGMEYLGVYRGMMKRSQASSAQKRRATWLWGVLSVLALAFVLPSYATARPQTLWFANRTEFWKHTVAPMPGWLLWIGCLGWGISILHVYMDGIMYRMRNPATRRHLAPLLSDGRDGHGEGARIHELPTPSSEVLGRLPLAVGFPTRGHE